MNNFNAEIETKNIVKFIRRHFNENQLGGAVLGISGGKDSGTVAALLVKALGNENVIGVWMPCHSKSEDMKDAQEVADYFNIQMLSFNLTDTYDVFKKEATEVLGEGENYTVNSDINVKPRLRMATLYYIAAYMTEKTGKQYIVAGTGNKCEIFVGYFTKWGDGASDIALIADYTVDEVIKIGEYLNVPKACLYKAPNDGLTGKTDEEKLGVKYSEIVNYIENPQKISASTKEKIKTLHEKSQHKFIVPTYRRKWK